MESIFYIYNCPDLLYNSEYMKCPIYFHLSHPIYFQLPKATRISPKYPNLLSFPKSLHFTQIIQFYSSRYHFQNYIIYPIYPYYPNFHIFNPNYSTQASFYNYVTLNWTIFQYLPTICNALSQIEMHLPQVLRNAPDFPDHRTVKNFIFLVLLSIFL